MNLLNPFGDSAARLAANLSGGSLAAERRRHMKLKLVDYEIAKRVPAGLPHALASQQILGDAPVWIAGSGNGGAGMLFATAGGSALAVSLVLLAVGLVARRRRLLAERDARLLYGVRQRPANAAEEQLERFIMPTGEGGSEQQGTAQRPVVGLKAAAGPGGLKKSPSPVQSPETLQTWKLTHGGKCGNGAAAASPPEPAHQSAVDEVAKEAATDDGSMTVSLESTNSNEEPEQTGELTVKLHYAFDKNALQVVIVSASNLPSPPPPAGGQTMAASQQLDPYIKVQLLPEKQHKAKTRVVRNTSSPHYDEEFTFYKLDYRQARASTLHAAAVASDRYARDAVIGEAVLPLYALLEPRADGAEGGTERAEPVTVQLHSRARRYAAAPNTGELLVSLRHAPAEARLTVGVVRANRLPQLDVAGMADPYVKVYMCVGGQRVAKKATHVKKRTLAPVYNESFDFDLPSGDPAILEQTSVQLSLMDWDRVTRDELIGRCTVEGDHWEQMRQRPDTDVAQWHVLRP